MEPEKTSPKKRRTLRWWVIGLFLMAALLPWLFSSTGDGTVTWLGPTDLRHPPAPEILRTIKYKFLQITAPVLRHFQHNQNKAEARVFTMSPITVEQFNLGSAVSTNSDGLRVWILSPEKMRVLNDAVDSQPLINLIRRSRIFVSDLRSQVSSIQSLPEVLTKSPGTTNYIPVGMMLDIISKIKVDSVRVSFGMTYTEADGWSPDGNLLIKTNLALGCRAVITNGGGLLVEGSRGTNKNATNYWFALTSTILDAQGRPIKKP